VRAPLHPGSRPLPRKKWSVKSGIRIPLQSLQRRFPLIRHPTNKILLVEQPSFLQKERFSSGEMRLLNNPLKKKK
jgi:hypothetical protein